METLNLIDTLEDVIDRGIRIPFTGRSLLDKEELLELVQEIRLRLPDDLKQAKWIKEERQRILVEAQKEANGIIKNAEDKIISMINENEITKKAVEQANDIISSAQGKAKEIKSGSRQYADNILADLENIMEKSLSVIRENRQELRR